MKRRSENPGTRSLFRAVAIMVGVLVSCSSFAAAPNWWSERGVLVPNASADDYALVNQGQLKNLAAAAAAEMDARVPAGAGTAVHNLLASWETPNSQRNDFAPLNLGQLKNVAKPFYDQLITTGLTQSYPWAGGTPDDFALANIGQVKTLFSFALNIFGDRLATGLYSASLAVLPDATLWTWGPQPGDGYNHERSYPLPLASLSNVISASAGSYHAAVLKTDGTVSTWGHNDSGQLGDGTETDRSVPAPVLNLSNVISVKAGYAHTLALVQDGTVLAWGENYYGQLGNGDTTDASSPIIVAGLTSVRKIAAGYERSAALREDGTVWTWGYEHYDWEAHYQLTPTLVDGLTEVTDIAAGIEHVVVVKSDGTVWAWGANWANQLGNGAPNGLYQATPIQVPSLADIVSVASAYDHTLALARDGTVWAWGSNNSGQLGIGTTAAQSAPVHISSLTDVIAIAAGQWYSMAMKSDGTVWAWGAGGSNLGILPNQDSTVPVQTVLGLLDSNNNNMDDRWEWDYFGDLNQTTNGDFDGDGISNFAEYSGHTDPTDYYNGNVPGMSIVSGDNQTADPGVFLPEPLIVQVNDSNGQPLANAPVTFEADDGFVGLTPDFGVVDSTVIARSDANGRAIVYYETPFWINETATVTATAQSGMNSVSVQFTEMTDTPPPPEAPSDVTVLRQVDGSTLVTWVSHSTTEDGFVVRRQELDGTWDVVGLANAGTTSVVIPPPSEAIADTGDYDVGAYSFIYTNANYSDETNPATVRYAIIDLGTGTPMRVTNSGYALLRGWYPLHGGQRWFQGQIQDLTGGDDPLLAGGIDINEDGTVVGTILQSGAHAVYPRNGNPESTYPTWWFAGSGQGRVAVRWDVGQSAPTLLGPTFAFSINTAPDSLPYTGTAAESYALAIDNDGHIFGESTVDYQEAPAYFDVNGSYHGTQWGSLYSGYDFTSNAGLGDQSLVFSSGGFTTQGQPYYILRSRNGTTIGERSDPNGPPNDHVYTVNAATVSFTPGNINSDHEVLCESRDQVPPQFFLYDTRTNQVTKDLEIPESVTVGVSPYFASMALNRRQIPAYDANGQPILDESGQQLMKESPQVVGTDSTFIFTSGGLAALWEENPITSHYEMQYLDRLISPTSGWQLQDAYDINDVGVIASDGWYQAYDEQGNPSGPPQWKGSLLVPICITPNPLPTSGVGRAKIVFSSGFEIPVLTADSVFDVKIADQSVTDIHQDENDPHIIYFTPPAAPLGADGQPKEGDFDVEISGLDPSPLGLDPLVLQRFMHYTVDGSAGMKSFSDSNVVVTEEAGSYADYQKRTSGISDDDALALLGSIRETVTPLQMDLFSTFFEEKSIDPIALQSLQTKASSENAAAIGKYVPAGGGGGGIPLGVTIYADVPDAWEDGPTPAEFVICRPTADSTPLTVQYSVSGSAQAGTDYAELSGSALIPANATCVAITVVPIQHALGDAEKMLILTLSPSGSYQVGIPNTATITIHDFN